MIDEQIRKNRELGRSDNEPTDSDFDSTMPPAKRGWLMFGFDPLDESTWPWWFSIGLVLAFSAFVYFATGGTQ